MRKQSINKRGFTLIELMLAIAVFSVILIIITTGILRFTRQYYKGVIEGQTQATARAIMDDVTRAIQFNGGEVSPLTITNPAQIPDPVNKPALGYCLGQSKRYSFYLNSQVTDSSPNSAQHQHYHGLVTDSVRGCSTNTPALSVQDTQLLTSPTIHPALSNPRELLGEHMRLANLKIAGNDNVWTVTVRVVYGDDDLLCSPTNAALLCKNPPPDSSAWPATVPSDLSCRSTDGSQFCAVSELTTTVDKRVK